MPPLPKSSRRPSTGKRDRDTGTGSSSAPPTAGARSRTTKAESLQNQIARFYVMVGTALRPFGRFYPVLAPVGDQFRELSQEAADSWIELGQKDKRVLEVWESLTGASAWGNVIGIHFAIFAAAIPGGEYFQQMQPPGDDQPPNMRDEFYRQGKAMGLDDDEIEQAIAQAMGTPMPAKDAGSGGPGDSVRAQPPPKHDGTAQATATAAPPVAQSRAAIVTPQQLGVTQVGLDNSFPADAAPPNGTGVVNE